MGILKGPVERKSLDCVFMISGGIKPKKQLLSIQVVASSVVFTLLIITNIV